MFSPERILDRGRILIGMLVIVPLGVLAPAFGGPTPGGGPTWAITAAGPNPLDQAAPTPQDVLAELTNPTVESPSPSASPPPAEAAPPTGSKTPPAAASAPPSAGDEVGTESTAVAAPEQIPGTDLNALGDAQPAATPTPDPPGPPPVATVTVAAYTAPKGAPDIFPVAGGATFTDDWEAERAGGVRHQGIDLFATSGTPVVAVSDGTLFRVGWNAVGGWRLWLRDTWGNEFYYAHLAAFAPGIVEGSTVRAGTVLAVVGNSGDATTAAPHLHFEVHPHGGDPVAPFPFVSAWPRV